jgi:acyl dehydratase
MTSSIVESLEVGAMLPQLRFPPLSRTTLALYAGASGDHIQLHIDTDVARKAGMPDVFGHGMLAAAWLGRLLTNWVEQSRIRSVDFRFTGITHLQNEIVCTGHVTEKIELEGESCVKVEIQAANQYGEKKILGQAVIAL